MPATLHTVPVWFIAAMIAAGSVGVTLALDRAALAAAVGEMGAQVRFLDKDMLDLRTEIRESAKVMQGAHQKIVDWVERLDRDQQRLDDRQDEIRRKLGLDIAPNRATREKKGAGK